MIRLSYFLLLIFISACATKPVKISGEDNNAAKADTTKKPATKNTTNHSFLEDSSEMNFATYYVVIADTSTDYYLLDNKMFELSRQLTIPIDTMGRFYNKIKNLIALPDHDEDEIYAGDYFQRRLPSENLSLEYLNVYQNKAGEKTIALVTGIYETEKRADSAVVSLRGIEKNVFKIKAILYEGCMH